MEGKLKKVLLVEDDSVWLEFIGRGLGDKVVLLLASTIEKAEKMFNEHPDINLIIMDACVPGDTPTTQPLIRKIRETFSGPMLAISSIGPYRKQLLAAGCDYECEKPGASKKALEILGIS